MLQPIGETVVGHGANLNTPEPYHAARVMIPIIRVMAEVPMCWADRERCADALIEALWQYGGLMREHRMMQGDGGGRESTTPGKDVI